jgi:AcrR family transcriptional regulator
VAKTAGGTAQHETVETRRRILAAAERLFAEKGFEATSVRDITSEAGCNVASVNYHFRGKENLYVETFRGLLGELRDRRILRIQTDMGALGDRGTLERFVESMANAFLEPLVAEDRGRLLMAFVSREMVDRHLPASVFFDEFIRPIMEVALAQLERVGPPMDPVDSRLCLMSLVGQLLHVLRAQHMLKDGGPVELVPTDLADHVRHVVRFSAGGIRACAYQPDDTTRQHVAGGGTHGLHS